MLLFAPRAFTLQISQHHRAAFVAPLSLAPDPASATI
jgi:hypothetical protein